MVSFARIAGTSTTYAGTNVYSAPTATSTAGSGSTGQEVSDYQLLTIFTKPYLDAHSLSFPSWRYAYYTWFILIFCFIVWTIVHQTRWRLGAAGAAVRKIGMRRFTFGKSRQANASQSTPTTKPTTQRQPWATPTVSQLFGLAVLLGFTFVMCYVGPDYINPRECMFGGECGYHAINGDNATDQYSRKIRRALAEAVEAFHMFTKRRTARYGWSPLNDPLLSGPNYTIQKGYWESSSRVGLIAYALLPLSVSLALKQWPMNIFATPFFTNLKVDKTAFWHKWMGRLIWALSTVHTGLWTKQLFVDINPFDEPTWNTSWRWHRLMAGGVAYGFLTALVAFSFKPLRTRYYEIFYYSHVVLVLGFLVAIIIHYQALQGWCLLAACLWGLERLTRACIYLFLNYGRGIPVFGEGKVGKSQFLTKNARESGFKVHHVEKRMSADGPKYMAAAASPYGGEEWSAASASTQNLQSHPLPYGAGPYTPNASTPRMYSSPAPSYHKHPNPNLPLVRPIHRSQAIPKGYALAQLLPGKVIKLTLHTPRHLSWKSGQHVQLTIPSIRWWQSHPYTISNDQTFTEKMLSLKPEDEPAGGSEIVLLISVRRGFTKALYKSIFEKRKRLVSAASVYTEDKLSSQVQASSAGVLIRAQTYLANGSAARAHWNDHSTVVLIAAGTGVTYSMAVLEHLCYNMAAKDAALRGETPSWATKKGRKAKPTKVNRVRFVWIMREYAHLAWIAPALRRCLDISDPARLRIDLIVTRDSTQHQPNPASTYDGPSAGLKDQDAFRPPAPHFARHTRNHSMESNSNDSFQTIVNEQQYSPSGDKDHLYSTESRQPLQEPSSEDPADFSVTDMILFDGEDDYTTPMDEEISKSIKKEGKFRRALSRRKKGLSGSQQPLNNAYQQRAAAIRQRDPESDLSGDEGASNPRTQPQSQSQNVASHQYPPRTGPPASRESFDSYNLDNDSLASGTGYLSPLPRGASTPSVPLLSEEEAGAVDMDVYDREDLKVVAELAKAGKPDLDGILDFEIENSQGSVMVACCGPTPLNNLVRKMVAKRISPSRIAKGDSRGDIELLVEDFTA